MCHLVELLSITVGVVPQSLYSFRPAAPASTIASRLTGSAQLPLPVNSMFVGKPSVASSTGEQ